MVNSTTKNRLLLVDDDGQLLHTLAVLLSRRGFELETYLTAAEAMGAVVTNRFDVILSDISMPGLDGLNLIRMVRRVDLDVPIVLMTGVPSLESAIQAVEFGAFRYLEKPVDPESLVKVLGQACSVHNLSRLRREATGMPGATSLQLGQRSSLEVRFSQAMGRLWLALQPIMDTQSGAPIGYETFVRSDESTLPMPNDLLDAAARLGRSYDLGRRVRAMAAEVAHGLPEGRQLFVNVSAAELNDNEMLSQTAPLSSVARKVVLEITERESLDGVSGLGTRLGRLRARGFRLALDGLGSGYADLAGFSRVEPEFVKLGGEMIRELGSSGRRQSLVRGMSRILSRDLGVSVVGTSVETLEERVALEDCGVHLLQGQVFGEELDARKGGA